MSNLKITTRTNSAINPEFVAQFLLLAADTEETIPLSTLRDECPLLDDNGLERANEILDIYNMAEFMLNTGSQLAYVDQNRGFHFGDVDLMDMYDDWTGWTVLQHELEDEPSFVDNWIEQNFNKLYKTIQKVNIDCKESGESVVPYSDVDYYAEQLHNIMNFTEEQAAQVAITLRKFEAFQATCRDVEDVSFYNEDFSVPTPGRIYLDDLTIERMTDDPKQWYLHIENCQYQSDVIEDLELVLFQWALGEREALDKM